MKHIWIAKCKFVQKREVAQLGPSTIGSDPDAGFESVNRGGFVVYLKNLSTSNENIGSCQN